MRIERRREGEHVSVDLGLGDDVVRQDRRAVERQRARRRRGHDRHARQRVAGVGIVEAEVVRREGVRPVLARRHRLVGRRRRGVGGGGAHRAVDPNQDGPTLHRIVQKVPREAPHRTEPVFKDIRNTPPGRSAALLGIGLCRNGNDTDRAGILQHQKIGRREGERCVRRCGEGEGSSPHGRQGSRTGQDGDLGARRRPAVECHRR